MHGTYRYIVFFEDVGLSSMGKLLLVGFKGKPKGFATDPNTSSNPCLGRHLSTYFARSALFGRPSQVCPRARVQQLNREARLQDLEQNQLRGASEKESSSETKVPWAVHDKLVRHLVAVFVPGRQQETLVSWKALPPIGTDLCSTVDARFIQGKRLSRSSTVVLSRQLMRRTNTERSHLAC